MNNRKLKFWLWVLSFIRLFAGKSYKCQHVNLEGYYLHKGVMYRQKCVICEKFSMPWLKIDNQQNGIAIVDDGKVMQEYWDWLQKIKDETRHKN